MTSARLFIESEKLEQADEFAKQLKVCTKSLGTHNKHLQ